MIAAVPRQNGKWRQNGSEEVYITASLRKHADIPTDKLTRPEPVAAPAMWRIKTINHPANMEKSGDNPGTTAHQVTHSPLHGI